MSDAKRSHCTSFYREYVLMFIQHHNAFLEHHGSIVLDGLS